MPFSLARCFDEESKRVDGAGGLLLALSRCQLLQDVRSFLGGRRSFVGFPGTL